MNPSDSTTVSADVAAFDAASEHVRAENAKLILLPKQTDLDIYAAAVALHLAAKSLGHSTIVANELPTVELSAIRGIDQVTTQLPSPNLVITLDNAVGQVEKVSYFLEGSRLKLVVHPQAGAPQFDPSHITINAGSSALQTIFAVGIGSKAELTELLGTQQLDKNTQTVVITNNETAQSYGTINIIDGSYASVSELVAQVLELAGLIKLDQAVDIAANMLTGIRSATRDFTDVRVRPETFELAGRLARLAAHAYPPQVPVPHVVPIQTQGGLAEPEPDWLTPKIYKGTSLL